MYNIWFTTTDCIIIIIAIIALLGIVQGFINYQNAKVVKELDATIARLRKIIGDIK